MLSVLIDLEIAGAMPEKPIDLIILQRIDDEQKATASRVNGIDQRLQSLALEVNTLAGSIRPPIEAAPWVRFFVYPACVLIAAGMVTTTIALLVKVNGLETFIHDNGGVIAGIRLEKVTPSDPKNAQETEHIIAQAKKSQIKIPQDVLKDTGGRFIDASNAFPDAWQAALAVVDYRSYLNGPNPPPLSAYYPLGMIGNPDHLEAFQIFVSYPKGRIPPQFTTSLARADMAFSARLDPIGHPLPQTAKKGAASILGVGGAFDLSGLYLRHVVLYDVEVHYNGGPLILEDVTFINCRFVMNETKDTRQLASQVLADRSVQFTA
jgi:hypothetical protein